MSANMDSHFGMEQQTTVTTKPVYSMAPSNMPIGMIATKKVGPNNLVVVYKDHASDEKATAHFVPDTSDIVAATKQTSDYQQTNGDQAVVKTTTTKWVYKSQLLKNLFHEEGQDNTIHVSHVVEIPATWRVVSQ
ncbi:DUF4811 domain-containing protein [Lactobacillaceae bacterium L1_55_11]|nr:DUF4811 domain-containing protein [Lactobacillaceae bacterium L1_55_11]